ncbi:growth factor receptor-bound protein 14-like [Ischnura elegans]|uniref:growth factor receptor-bound protein 14-like n=1 Tax=Ischnura elegans TaxID=197161 RepID=UPI001ED885EC|nr:growth factor receptor-bound protein 14-like [Ischnura elegans]
MLDLSGEEGGQALLNWPWPAGAASSAGEAVSTGEDLHAVGKEGGGPPGSGGGRWKGCFHTAFSSLCKRISDATSRVDRMNCGCVDSAFLLGGGGGGGGGRTRGGGGGGGGVFGCMGGSGGSGDGSSIASYERLPSIPTLLELNAMCSRDPEEKDMTNEKEEMLTFYNDDGSYQSVVVERNLCSADLCNLLAIKNRVTKDVNWTIVEHWVELGIERSLEDHEDVLAVHHEMEAFGRRSEKRFIFRKDFRKYEFFHNPQQFFPKDMVDLNSCEELVGQSSVLEKSAALETLLSSGDEAPPIFGHVWVREANKQVWSKAFLLLKEKKLYLSYKVQVVAKFLRSWKGNNKDRGGDGSEGTGSSTAGGNSSIGGTQLQVFAHLADYNVYSTLNAKNQFRAPTEFGLCLRPTAYSSSPSPASSTSSLDGPPSAAPDEGGPPAAALAPKTLRCLACDSEGARLCWVTAMRLAKYGKQLRENYRAFKNKQVETMSPKEYNSHHVPNESVRSRVAMDFTGSVGRIVEDPKEARAIAMAEGYLWKKRWRPTARQYNNNNNNNNISSGGSGSVGSTERIEGSKGNTTGGTIYASNVHPKPQSSSSLTQVHVQGIESGIHITQPWFHSGMTREQASQLVSRHGTVDGVFLVRESRSTPGSFVLTFKYRGKVFHYQIQPVVDPVRDAVCYSLDSGTTKFYDLLQLVEFYQLNAGCLPTRLTHYVVLSPGPIVSHSRMSSAPSTESSSGLTPQSRSGGADARRGGRHSSVAASY